jgi:hypothetical protein
MNTLLKTTLILFAIASTAFAEKEHSHDKPIPGPKGGRILEVEGGHAEFFVQPDNKVSITFYDSEMKPAAPDEQVVKVVAEAPSGKTTLDFEKSSPWGVAPRSYESRAFGAKQILARRPSTECAIRGRDFGIDNDKAKRSSAPILLVRRQTQFGDLQ